jgi:DNA-binding MarR family transcriptional regulator
MMINFKRSPTENAYLRFLQLAKAIQSLPDAPLLDANENALLEAIALRWFENKPMTVREAIGISQLGSPATLHKRITRLRNRDLVQTFNQPDDKRAKYLIPTDKSIAMFKDFGKKMNAAISATP